MNLTKTPSLTISGPISKIAATKTVGNGFKIRKLWLKFDDSYSSNGKHVEKINYPEFQFTGNKCDELDQFKAGDVVEISFNPQGTPWTNKEGKTTMISQNRAWKISGASQQAQPVHALTDDDLDDSDDLPF